MGLTLGWPQLLKIDGSRSYCRALDMGTPPSNRMILLPWLSTRKGIEKRYSSIKTTSCSSRRVLHAATDETFDASPARSTHREIAKRQSDVAVLAVRAAAAFDGVWSRVRRWTRSNSRRAANILRARSQEFGVETRMWQAITESSTSTCRDGRLLGCMNGHVGVFGAETIPSPIQIKSTYPARAVRRVGCIAPGTSRFLAC